MHIGIGTTVAGNRQLIARCKDNTAPGIRIVVDYKLHLSFIGG